MGTYADGELSSDGDGWDGELPVWVGDKDEGFAGEVGMTDRWGSRIVGPGCQWQYVVNVRVREVAPRFGSGETSVPLKVQYE